MTKVFLDMDGVIADFMAAICNAHHRPSPYFKKENLGEFQTEKCWGLTDNQFWAPVLGDSLGFWRGIEKTPEADKLVELLTREFGEENIAILTAPSDDIGSVHGKRLWIRKYFPQFYKRLIFAGAQTKQFLAGPDKLLVDDRDRNIDQFVEAGGEGILVPRLWNRMHYISNESFDVVKNTLSWRKHGR